MARNAKKVNVCNTSRRFGARGGETAKFLKLRAATDAEKTFIRVAKDVETLLKESPSTKTREELIGRRAVLTKLMRFVVEEAHEELMNSCREIIDKINKRLEEF